MTKLCLATWVVGGQLGRCQCAGKLYAWRPKAIMRPSKVLMHWVHYAVVGVDAALVRHSSSPEADELASTYSNVTAFRLPGGHRLPLSDPVGCASIVLAALSEYADKRS